MKSSEKSAFRPISMRFLKRSGFKGLNVLITSGPTSVPIDEMRVITNRSSGEMGRLIANALAVRGASVTLLEGAVTTSIPAGKIAIRKFFEFRELAEALREELQKRYDWVIHAAAVSDFELAKPFEGKIASSPSLTLRLKQTRKLVNDIKHLSPRSRLVAFKLEPSLAGIRTKALGLFEKAKADLLVANSSGPNDYEAFIIRRDGSTTECVKSKKDLVKVLLKEIDSLL
jgi:phosphopantothenoylcysteine decarboxylase/phosphopantothenate--cysteine ligase